MKTIATIALVSVLAAGLSACDKKETTKSETTTTVTAPKDGMMPSPAASDPAMMAPGSKVETETKTEKK